MKELSNTLLVCALIVSTCITKAWGQIYTMRKPLDTTEVAHLYELCKQVFPIRTGFDYQITSFDLFPSFDKMPRGVKYDNFYKELLDNQILNDPKNAFLWYKLGFFYRTNGQEDKALESFQKAYDLLNKSSFKDEAAFYSLQGVLKINLGMEISGTIALKHALQINPNDSLAMALLPTYLSGSGKYTEARSYCITGMENSSNNVQATWYLNYVMSYIFEGIDVLSDPAQTPEGTMEISDYDKLFDLKSIDEIYSKYKMNPQMGNVRLMTDIFILTLKFELFLTPMDGPRFEYTSTDTERLIQIRNELLLMKDKQVMNEYSRLKNIAFVNLMLQETNLSVDYFEQAINALPEDKINDALKFSSTTCYNALFAICFSLTKDNEKAKLTLKRKFDEKKDYPADTKLYTDLARCYLEENNYQKSYFWAEKAYNVSDKDVDASRLIMNYYFIYVSDPDILEKYYNKASENLRTELDRTNLMMQMAIYNVIAGNPENAHSFIQIVRDIYKGNRCALCDELETEYIQPAK